MFHYPDLNGICHFVQVPDDPEITAIVVDTESVPQGSEKPRGPIMLKGEGALDRWLHERGLVSRQIVMQQFGMILLKQRFHSLEMVQRQLLLL